MKKKMLIFDIDGTLYDHYNDEIPQSTINTLKKIKEETEHYLIIATGRAKFNTEKVKHIFPLFDALVFVNGLHIVKGNEDLYVYEPDSSTVGDVIDTFEELGLIYGCFTTSEEYISSVNKQIEEDFKKVSLDLPEIRDIKEITNIQQLYVFGNSKDFRLIEERHPGFNLMQWHESGADLIPVEADKAEAVKYLASHFDHPLEDTIAFGDAGNDILMIKEAGIGVAMGNGSDELKAVADLVALPIDENGIEDAIYKLGILKK